MIRSAGFVPPGMHELSSHNANAATSDAIQAANASTSNAIEDARVGGTTDIRVARQKRNKPLRC